MQSLSAMEPSERLRKKLGRELAQSEHDARLHTRREAKKLGDVWPAATLVAIAAHADAQWPALLRHLRTQPIGWRLGRAVGAAFSALRHFCFDRLIDSERSFRATLLGLKHGVDVVRLLHEVALGEADDDLVAWCEQFLDARLALLAHAEQSLEWFAEHPRRALASGARVATEPVARPTT